MSNKSLNYLNLNKNNLPYNISIITDTLFYSILKVVVKGNIRDPVPLVDVNSLIGTTIQSALMQFGGGYPLLEDSKATCAIAGAPCIEIIFHGQVAVPSTQNVENTDEEVMSQLLPLFNVKEIENPSPSDGIELTIE